MPGAVIVADQNTGAGAGSPGVARRDLWQSRAVSLYLGVGGNTTYLWELLSKPTGSAAALTSSTASTSGFTPDLVGTYRIRLTVNGGGPGNVQTRVYRCRYNNVGALASRGWAVPAYGETAAEANYDTNAIGYGEVFETILADILANLGGGSVPTGTGIAHIVAGVQQAAASLIVDADIHASAAIALSKIVNPTGTGLVKSVGGVIGAAAALLVNADIDAAAGISLSKLAGLATGVETFLGTPSSANLRAVLTDETGTGAAVFATSPALTTPQLTDPYVNGQKQGATVAVAAMEIDWALGPVHTKTLAAGANTFTFANQASGMVVVVRVTGAASTLTWPTVKWPGGVAPTQTASGTDVYTFVHDGTSIYGSVVQAMA